MATLAATALPARSRPAYAVVLLATITLGLLSRRYPLLGILAEYTGDALYTVAAFVGLALLLVRASARSLAIMAFSWSAAVECSQLLSWPWIMDLRNTQWGRLVLGSGFQWADLIAYLIGAIVAAGVDSVGSRRHVRIP